MSRWFREQIEKLKGEELNFSEVRSYFAKFLDDDPTLKACFRDEIQQIIRHNTNGVYYEYIDLTKISDEIIQLFTKGKTSL